MAKEAKKKLGEETEAGFLGKANAVAKLVQSCLIIGSILAAGVWFLLQAEASPKANISHIVTHRQLTDKWVWVHVAITVSNPGKRPLYLEHGTFRIQAILPLDIEIADQIKRDVKNIIPPGFMIVQWPQVGNAYEKVPINQRIDPGESDKLNAEFIIPSFLQTIKVYTHFEKASGMGWAETTIYQLHK
jgi:hypothetical protein